MKNDKNYPYCKVLCEMFSNDAHSRGDTRSAALFRLMDFDDPEDRELLSLEIGELIKGCHLAQKELEGKTNGSKNV